MGDSVWSAIHASWICDDEEILEASKNSRKQALSLIDKAGSYEKLLSDQVGATEVIAIDLMRRVGMFSKGLKLVKSTKVKDVDEVIFKVIDYEEKLIERLLWILFNSYHCYCFNSFSLLIKSIFMFIC